MLQCEPFGFGSIAQHRHTSDGEAMTSVNLRRVRPDDTDLIHAWRNEPSIALHQPLVPMPRSQIRELLRQRSRTSLAPEADGEFQWLIVAGDTPVGWISLKVAQQDRPHGRGSIGYAISEAHRGHGFAASAVGALLPVAFDRNGLALDRIEAVAAVDNLASRRVLEINGFRFEGIQRGLLVIRGARVDHAMYGLLRTDRPTFGGPNR